MSWKDDFGRPEIFIHPDLVSGEADWRVEVDGHGNRPTTADTGDDGQDDVSKERGRSRDG